MEHREIRLVALDLDGTLLHEDKSLSDRTLNTLQQLADRGIRVVPATGRDPDGINGNILRVNPVHHAVCSNGAVILDPGTGEVLHSCPILPESAREALDYFRDFSAFTYLHTDCGQVCSVSWEDSGLTGRYPNIRFESDVVPDLLAWVREKSASLLKIGVFPRDDEAFRALMAAGSPSPDLVLMRTGVCSVELNSINASKGRALKTLCRLLDIPMSSVLAIGDNQNDMEMLRFAGVSVAMGNAEDDVKAEAMYVTGTNDQDGAAAFLEKYFGLK